MVSQYRIIFAIALLHLFAGGAHAFTSSLGVETSLLEPAGWNVGDAGSTHQVWDAVAAATLNEPDHAYDTAGVTLTVPTLSVKPPGFRSGTSNFYSFAGDFGATADIYNHGGPATGRGTHVIVQVGASLNPDEESFPGHGTGVYLDTMKLLDLSNNPLAGGGNSDARQIAEVRYDEEVFSSFGYVEYQELIFEFWLPGYTGDFRVDWEQKVHATIDTLRIDSMVVAEAVGGGTPFPLTSAGTANDGDFNHDGAVDAADYVVWRKDSGSHGGAQGYTDWVINFGQSPGSGAVAVANPTVPEPTTALLLTLAAGFGICGRRGGALPVPRARVYVAH